MNASRPTFLSVERVRELHDIAIATHGGVRGVRDDSLLKSAVAQPRSVFGGKFLHKDLAEMAAAYLYHVGQSQSFIDGNKRAGAMAAVVFLNLNGFDLNADNQEFENLVLRVGSGELDKTAVAAFLRKHMRPANS